jgi:ABC-type lipopolysaccharide export system ATPase subunit
MKKYTIYQMPSMLRRMRAIFFEADTQVFHSDYVGVYRGEIKAEITPPEATTPYELDTLFHKFNIEHPENYAGVSMSGGDVIMLEDEYYLCCSMGWAKLDKEKFFATYSN